MSNIPIARKKLRLIAHQLREIGLHNLATGIEEIVRDDLIRKKMTDRPRSKVHSRPMSKALAAEIREYVDRFPHLSHRQIGDELNVSIGRVSDAYKKKWGGNK